MTQRCANCGAELFKGQQFCRQCGARTAGLGGEAPTQILGGGAGAPTAVPPPPATTSPLPPGATTSDPLRGARHTNQQTPYGGQAYTSHLAAASGPPPARRSRWLVPGLLGLLLVVCAVGVLAAVMLWRSVPMKKIVVMDGHGGRAAARAGGEVLGEEGAAVAGDETVIARSFELEPGATLAINNLSGDIQVEGWDGESTEVKVVKRGGDAEARRAALVKMDEGGGGLALSAAPQDGHVQVAFEVKVPREGLGRVELTSANSRVRVSRLSATLAVEVKNGTIELEDVRGAATTSAVNGTTRVVYAAAEREGAHEFKSVNGRIEVRLAEGMGADLSAEVVHGRIEVDPSLGLEARQQMVGRKVEGRVGGGGEPLTLKTVNGTIKVGR